MRAVRSDWQGAVLVCGKCSKKLDGGYGPKGKTSLAKGLRKLLGAKKGRRSPIGIVESKCLGVCPKRAAMLVDTRRPDQWLVVPAGADLDEVAERLGVNVVRPHAPSPRT